MKKDLYITNEVVRVKTLLQERIKALSEQHGAPRLIFLSLYENQRDYIELTGELVHTCDDHNEIMRRVAEGLDGVECRTLNKARYYEFLRLSGKENSPANRAEFISQL